MTGDRGDIVVGWLVRIALSLTLLGVVLFDAVSVGLAHVGAQDDGTNAAAAASDVYLASHNVQRAFLAAVEYAEEHGSTVVPKSFRVDPDGRVHLVVEKTATTMLLYRLGPLHRWGEVRTDASAKSVPAS